MEWTVCIVKFNYIGVLVVVLMFGAQYVKAEVGVTDTEVVIGAHEAESGVNAGFANLGAAEEAYFKDVNEKGGVFGRKIRFIRKDGQGLAPKNVEVIRDLVEKEKVFAIVGSIGLGHLAVYKYLNEKGVPDMYFLDFSSLYTDKALKYSFPLWATTHTESSTGVRYLVNKKKVKKICVAYLKNAVGEEYLKGVQDTIKEFNSKGNKVALGPVSGVDPTAIQVDAEILSFQQAKCDAVMINTVPPLTPSALNYAASQGYKPQWIVGNTNLNPKLTTLLNDNVPDGATGFGFGARDRDSAIDKGQWDEYEALMKKNNLLPNSGLSLGGYIIAELFVDALKRAGKNLTRASLAEAASSFKDYRCSICVVPLNSTKQSHTLVHELNPVILTNKKWIINTEKVKVD